MQAILGQRRTTYDMRFNPRFDRLILGTRLALIAGFGGLLIITTLAGMDTLRVLQQIRANGDQIRREFQSCPARLARIRPLLRAGG